MTRMLAAALLLCVAGGALGQLRTVPAAAKRAAIWHLHDRVVQIDKAQAMLSPGAQIRDADNRLVVPAAVPPGSIVKYQTDALGHVHRVWILTPEEAARSAPAK